MHVRINIDNLGLMTMKEKIKERKQRQETSALIAMLEPLYSKMDEVMQLLRNDRGRVLPKYYRNDDLKKIFGLSSNTIVKYRRTGILPFTMMGEIFLYDAAKVDKILKENSDGGR